MNETLKVCHDLDYLKVDTNYVFIFKCRIDKYKDAFFR